MLERLPLDAVALVFVLLDLQSILSCRALCRTTRGAWSIPLLWRSRLKCVTYHCISCPRVTPSPDSSEAAALARTEVAVNRQDDVSTDALVAAVNEIVPPTFAASRSVATWPIAVVSLDATELGGTPIPSFQRGSHLVFSDGSRVHHAIASSAWGGRRSLYDMVTTWEVAQDEDGQRVDVYQACSVSQWATGTRMSRVLYASRDGGTVRVEEDADKRTTATAPNFIRTGSIDSDLWDDFAYAFYCATGTVLSPVQRARMLARIADLVNNPIDGWFPIG